MTDILITMTVAEFEEQFKPLSNMVRSDTGAQYYLSEPELEFVQLYANDPKSGISVWTLMMDGKGNDCIRDGYHTENRHGHFLTRKAPEEGKQYFIQDETEEDFGPYDSEWCQSEHCTMDGGNIVPTVNGRTINYCGSCYDAYLVGLNRGMNQIIELPEAIKRSRLADFLVEHRHTPEMDMVMAHGRRHTIGYAAGVCGILGTKPETARQFIRILLSRMRRYNANK